MQQVRSSRNSLMQYLKNNPTVLNNLVCLASRFSPNYSGSLILLFATVPNSRINSWELWFFFNLRKINIHQYCKSSLRTWNNHNQSQNMLQITHDNFSLWHNCVIITGAFLNGHLLGAPCEYLNPGLDCDCCCSLP